MRVAARPSHSHVKSLPSGSSTRFLSTVLLPISVPGCVDGWAELHSKFGKMPLDKILAPTIAYAREGTPVPEVIAYYWASGAKVFKDQPGFAELFTPGGQAPAKGDIFKNPGLANTLEAIGRSGRDAFLHWRHRRQDRGIRAVKRRNFSRRTT